MKKFFLIINILVCSSVFSQVGIGTDNPKSTLHIIPKSQEDNNVLRLDQLRTEYIGGDNMLLGIDTSTNNVVKIGSPTVAATYFSSNDFQYLNVLNTNNSQEVPITFKSTESLSNNATNFDENTSVFTLKTNGIYEISGIVCFNPGRSEFSDLDLLKENQRIVINIKIQYSTDNGNSWKDFTATRKVYNHSDGDLNYINNVPAAVAVFNAGTKIRMTIMRPDNLSTLVANFDNNYPSDKGYPHINKPTGVNFTKAIKIFRF